MYISALPTITCLYIHPYNRSSSYPLLLLPTCLYYTHFSSRLSSLCFTPLRPKFNPRTGQRLMSEKFCQLLAVGQWFPPGTPVSSTRKMISSSSPSPSSTSFHRLDMTLAVAEVLNPNKPNQTKPVYPLVLLPIQLHTHSSYYCVICILSVFILTSSLYTSP